MSYFDNIVFDENTLLEGEQAEAYKAKKAAEKKADEEKSQERYLHRHANPNSEYGNNYGNKYITNQYEKAEKKLREKQKANDKPAKTVRDVFNNARKDISKSVDHIYSDLNRDAIATDMVDAHAAKYNNPKTYREKLVARDAANRYLRRHNNEAAEMLEAYNPELIEL